MLYLDGFDLISQGTICSAHDGLSVYLINKYDYKILSSNKVSKVWEGQFIEVFGNTIKKHIVLRNIHRPPRDVIENDKTFIGELYPILAHLQKTKSYSSSSTKN